MKIIIFSCVDSAMMLCVVESNLVKNVSFTCTKRYRFFSGSYRHPWNWGVDLNSQ